MSDICSDPRRLYSAEEIAESGFFPWANARYLRELVRRGEIGHLRIGRRVWFRLEHIEAFEASQEQRPNPRVTPISRRRSA